MKIISLLAQNLFHKSRTRCPDDAVPFPGGFRGNLIHDSNACTACGTCVYTCSPGAIEIVNNESEPVEWKYSEDRCTFCGFCVEYCPTGALSFSLESPVPIIKRENHYQCHVIERQPCLSCGKPVILMPLAMLEQIYGKPLPEEIAETQGLCEHCRQQLISKRFLQTVVVKGDRKND